MAQKSPAATEPPGAAIGEAKQSPLCKSVGPPESSKLQANEVAALLPRQPPGMGSSLKNLQANNKPDKCPFVSGHPGHQPCSRRRFSRPKLRGGAAAGSDGLRGEASPCARHICLSMLNLPIKVVHDQIEYVI